MKVNNNQNYSDIHINKFIKEHIENKSDIEVFLLSSVVYSAINNSLINNVFLEPLDEKLVEFDFNKWFKSGKINLRKCLNVFKYIMSLNDIVVKIVEASTKSQNILEVGFNVKEQNKKLINLISNSFNKVIIASDNLDLVKNVLNSNITELSLEQKTANIFGDYISEADAYVKEFLSITLNHINNTIIPKDTVDLIDVDPKQTEIIIALNELGILDYLRDKHPHLKMSANGFANIIHLITGKQTESLVSNINAMYSPKQKASKNNPYNSERIVKKVKGRLDKQLGLI